MAGVRSAAGVRRPRNRGHLRRTGRGLVWENWARNQRAGPHAVVPVHTEADIVAAVERAAAEGRAVKAMGSGHSFTSIAATDGLLLDLGAYDRVVAADPATGLVTVEAGVTLHQLNEELASRGLAMENLGDIAYQTISGATATGTHGTGARFGGLSTQIAGMRIVTGDGSVVDCSADERADVFAAARVGLGALGIVSTLTLRCMPAFRLHAVEEARRVGEVLEGLDEWVDGNDHVEFYWIPDTDWALTKTNRRTDEPAAPRPRWLRLRNEVLYENVLFGAVMQLGKVRPEWIPPLAKAFPTSGRQEHVERSDHVFTSPRHVRFVEMEYAVPREAFREAFDGLRRVVRRLGVPVGFPVECRFTAADDIALSTASGRATAYLAVHVAAGVPHDEYFAGVEAVMRSLDGRPHWGKLHGRTAADLAPAFPRWSEFQAVRAQVDPEGRFANAHLDRVLGPVAG